MAEVLSFPADFKELDDAKPSKLHWKIMFISGMGFFTDAYDLFIIGVVMTMLKPLWHVGKVEEGLVESTALLASAIGALLFGRVADMLGRKRIYGVEVLVLAFGAIGCAFSPNIWWLIGLRFILGIGIGGDYPVSATIMSEYSGKGSRGMMVTLVLPCRRRALSSARCLLRHCWQRIFRTTSPGASWLLSERSQRSLFIGRAGT